MIPFTDHATPRLDGGFRRVGTDASNTTLAANGGAREAPRNQKEVPRWAASSRLTGVAREAAGNQFPVGRGCGT